MTKVKRKIKRKIKKAGKHCKEHFLKFLVVILMLLISLSGIFYQPKQASGASYTFIQTNWSGGLSATSTASHPANQSGWAFYSSSTAMNVVNAGEDLQLNTASTSTIQTDNGATNTGFNLSGASHSQTMVTGSGSNASVKLGVAGGGSWATTNVDTTLTTNTYTSLKIGSDGFARIAYTIDSENVKFVQCANIACTSKNTVTIGGGSNRDVFLALDSNDLAMISYYFLAAIDLYIARCNNANCSNVSSTVIDSSGGRYPSIAIGSDGFARISYYGGSADLKFIQCTNATCSTNNNTTVDSAGDVGSYSSIALGPDGFPRISYYDTTNQGLKFVQCTNDACTNKNVTTIATSTLTLNISSLTIGSDGFARLAYYNDTNQDLMFVRCANDACTSKIITTADSINRWRENLSLALGSDGFARISYYDLTNLYLTQCLGIDCSSATSTLLNASGGQYSSLVLAPGDLAWMSHSYYPGSGSGNLKFTHQPPVYYTSGVFTSGAINVVGALSWGNLSWAQSGGQTITMKARSDADGDFSNATAWGSCGNISSGEALSTGNCVTDSHRYIQYQVALSTADTSQTPSLDDVTIGYYRYSASGNLISSAYNTSDAANVIASLSWDEDASLPSGTGITVSIKTASSSDNLGSAAWSDFSNSGCPKTGNAVTCTATSSTSIPAGMRDGSGDQWFQYKITLTSTEGNTPTISAVRVVYVVNAPPQFNPSYGTNGVAISQVATSTDADWGKVKIQYAVLDSDTLSGSPQNRGYITPSFEYSTSSGSIWTAISSNYLASGDLDNKAVSQDTYAVYTATWDAKSQIPNVYSTSTQIRVTANDNEQANNITRAISASFTVDTKIPAFSISNTSSTINVASGTVILKTADDSNIEYQISNNSDFSADGNNAISGLWQTVGGISTSTNLSWTFTNVSNYPKVYLRARDVYSNIVSSTIAAPSAPANFDVKDISNINTGEFREFIAWAVYSATSSAPFSNYKIYRSTDGGATYSLLTTISDINTNFYRDTAIISSSTVHYYKMIITDTDGDISNYSATLSDTPNGQGGTDFTPPTITNVSSTIQATWAKFTWTTDELSDSEINYSTSPSTAFNNTASSTSMVTSHEVTLTGLTPNTTYLYRVKSKDIFNNQRADDNLGAGYSFTTLGGPVISDVSTESIEDQSATIIWNTNKDSNSYVAYSVNLNNVKNNSGVSETGSAAMVGGPPYQHRVTLTNLNRRTTYYYYVKSTDSGSNTATDTNGGNYYSFTTTYDTKAPVITNVQVPLVTKTSAIVVWQTDELTDSQAEYGPSSGSYNNATDIDSTLSIYHTATIINLSRNTKYYYRVKSKDEAGNEGVSPEANFTTSEADQIIISSGGGGGAISLDTTAPTISNIEAKEIDAFNAIISFDTSEAAIGFVLFGRDTASYTDTVSLSDFKTKHQIKLSGLKLGTTYHFKIKAMDKSGNVSASEDKTFTTKFAAEALEELVTLENASQFQDQLEGVIESVLPSLVPPFLGKIAVDNITESSAVIKWRTNVPAYSALAYVVDKDYDAKKDNLYTTEISGGEIKARDHEIAISGLSPSTIYHLQAKSFIIPGAVGRSKDTAFATIASKIKPELTRLGNTQVDVRWVTDSETSSFAEAKNLKTGKIIRSGDQSLTKAHAVSLENLTPGTPYEIRVFGYDANNIIVEGDPLQVRTKQDTTPPQAANVKIDNALVPGRSDRLQSVVSWRTDEPANSIVEFEEGVGSVEENKPLLNRIGQEKEFVSDHAVIITAFKPSTVYRIRIISEDESGNKTVSPIRTILTPKSAESVVDIISRNFQETFGFLKKLQK